MKLQVLVSDDLTLRLDRLAKYSGTSRSALCSSIIIKHLPEWEKILNSVDLSEDTSEEFEQLQIQ